MLNYFVTYLQDFEQSGIFDAQCVLESRQKKEEDELYATFKRDKEKKIERLEKELLIEKEKSVSEMIEAFEQLKKYKDKDTLEVEKKKLESHYRLVI